jgi:hypothetical protein
VVVVETRQGQEPLREAVELVEVEQVPLLVRRQLLELLTLEAAAVEVEQVLLLQAVVRDL